MGDAPTRYSGAGVGSRDPSTPAMALPPMDGPTAGGLGSLGGSEVALGLVSSGLSPRTSGCQTVPRRVSAVGVCFAIALLCASPPVWRRQSLSCLFLALPRSQGTGGAESQRDFSTYLPTSN